MIASSLFMAHATLGVYAIDMTSGKVLLDINSNTSLVPSSCMKIVTTGAALHLLGADYRFETHLEYDGYIDSKKTLYGNIYIHGGGDPCLGSFSWEQELETWGNALQHLGITRIKGKILSDATKWEKALAAPTWAWEDLGNYYGAGASALTFHKNSYTLFFKPGNQAGDPTTILRTDPPLPFDLVQNEVTTGPEGSGDHACIYGSEFSPIQFVRGTIPANVPEFSIKGTIPDPPTYAAHLLTQILQKKGVIIEEQNLPASARISFHTTLSPTVEEIVHSTNQKSINLYAEHLLKKMGEVVYNEGSTTAGIKAVTNFWKSQNINLEGFHMADGSGLSRTNLITPKQLVEILLTLKKSKFFPVFFESLPQKDNFIRAKSGHMSLNQGYTGYAGTIAFAILVNQCTNPKLLQEQFALFFNSLYPEGSSNL